MAGSNNNNNDGTENKVKDENRTNAGKTSEPLHEEHQEKEKTSLAEYFRGVRTEMRKVVWPTKQELGSYTVIVLAACAFFALAFWGIDSGFLAILKGILGISL
ncbi:MAG: preprotein translocase subunit SecE [Anaerovoracaceae bacterium]|jgi:preprotein translocase subunit SecE